MHLSTNCYTKNCVKKRRLQFVLNFTKGSRRLGGGCILKYIGSYLTVQNTPKKPKFSFWFVEFSLVLEVKQRLKSA